jgi:hypothetical protein
LQFFAGYFKLIIVGNDPCVVPKDLYHFEKNKPFFTPLRGYTSFVSFADTFPSRGRLTKLLLNLKLTALLVKENVTK